MDRTLSAISYSRRKDLSERIRELSRRLERPLESLARRIEAPLARTLLGVLGLLTSILLASYAHSLSYERAGREWLADHAPEADIWKHVLGTYGWTEVRHGVLSARLFRTLPLNFDSKVKVWIDGRGRWAAIFLEPERPAFFTRVALPPLPPRKEEGRLRLSKGFRAQLPSAWNPLGAGWPGLEALAIFLKENRPAPSPAPSRPKGPRGDPREIRY